MSHRAALPIQDGRRGLAGSRMPIMLLLTLAAVLRLYGLNAQLWLDEVAALEHLRRPLGEILTTFPGFFPHPLYEILGHLSLTLFGEHPFAMRLPAALFGIAGVLMLYRLSRRVSDRGESLLAAALFAVSYHHIFFSQDARGYTTFLFLALAATDRMVTLLQRGRAVDALAYGVLAALAVYAHPFGVFVPAGQLGVALFVSWIQRRAQRPSRAPGVLITAAFTAAGGVVLLFAPFVQGSASYLSRSRLAGGPTVFRLLPELLEGLVSAFQGPVGLGVAVALGTVGLLGFARRHPVVTALLIAPLVAGAVATAAFGMAVLHPRYFIFALPIGYLVGTRGLVTTAQAVLARLPAGARTRGVQVAGAVAVVLAATLPLRSYYATPKQDFVGTLRVLDSLAGADRAVAVQLAGYPIRDYYRPHFPVVDTLEELRGEEAAAPRLWAVTTLERILAESEPDLYAHLRQQYELIRVLPGTVGDGAMRIYRRRAEQGSP